MKRFLRVLIALVLLAAAIGKLIDLPGFTLVLRGYRFFPVPLLWPVAVVITGTELLLACWLLWGRALRRAAQTATALHLLYAAWAAFMLLRDKPILNCGCFGSFIARPLSWATVTENLVLTALCLALYALCSREGRVMPKYRYE